MIYSHFNGLVPVNNVTGEDEALNVDHMNVTTLRTHVQPLALERKVHESYPETFNYRSITYKLS